MTIYLNDLSLEGGKGLLEDWEQFKAFSELIDELSRKGQVSLIAPKDLWNKPLGGIDVPSKTLADGSPIPADQGNFVHQIYRKFRTKTQGEPLFSENEDMTVTSSSVGLAAECEAPVISITFDNRYAKEKLKGWLKSAGKEVSRASVDNLFSGSANNYRFITDWSKCRLIDPRKQPLWNQSIVKEILAGVDFISGSKEEKRERFIRYGREVAELNGWIYNKRVSSMNSSASQKRIVFDSEIHFTGYEICYLSIDLEGPDLCFEICNKRGKHLGEVDRFGNVSGPEPLHDLMV